MIDSLRQPEHHHWMARTHSPTPTVTSCRSSWATKCANTPKHTTNQRRSRQSKPTLLLTLNSKASSKAKQWRCISRLSTYVQTPHKFHRKDEVTMARRNTTTRDRHRKAIARGRPACAICGQPIDYDAPHTDPMSFVVDHIVPVTRDGTDQLNNKQAAHRQCNLRKSDRDFAPILRRSGSLN